MFSVRDSDLPVTAGAFTCFAIGAALLLGGAGMEGASLVPVHILFLAGAGLAAYGAGAAGGVAALVMIAFLFIRLKGLPVAVYDGPLAESVVAAFMGFLVRRNVLRAAHSERKLRAIFSSMRDVTTVMDSEGRYLEVAPTRANSSFVQEGRTAHELLPPETAGFVVKTIGEALARMETVSADYRVEGEGDSIWLSATVSPLSPTTVLWVARDITARKLGEEVLRSAALALEERVARRTADLRTTDDALHAQFDLRSAAEEALMTSENSYRNIVDQARDIIFTLDLEGRIISLNPAFTSLLGLEVSDWLGRNFLELIVPEERPAVAERYAGAKFKRQPDLFRATLSGADNRRVIIEASSSHQIVEGRSVGLLGFARDITERETAESERRRSQEQLVESQRLARLGSWDRDMESGVESWSDELYSILELDRETAVPCFETFASFVLPQYRPQLESLRKGLATSSAQEMELEVKLASGTCKNLRVSAHSSWESTERRRVMGAVQDLTEQKHAEQLLRESEERFRLLALATNDAVWDWDYLADFVWRGEAYETLFGYAPGTLEGTIGAWRALVHPDDRERVSLSLATAVDSGQLFWVEEYRFKRVDGSYAFVLDRGYIVRDASRRVARVLGAMMDLTEQKQLEQQVAQSHRLSSLGRVAASIAHEFNNVLMGIQPNVELIQRRAPAEMGKMVDSITTSVRRGKRITEEILRFTSPMEPRLQCLRVQDFFEGWGEEIRSLLGGQVTVDLRLPLEEIYFSADPLLIAQVFTNLAVNAREAMEGSGGTITIEAEAATSFSTFRFGVVRSPDRYVHLRVKDTGSGMSDDRLHHIFEPMFTTKRTGTGLGLAISHQIVTGHGGHIFVESEVGVGTTFHLFLPLAMSPSMTAAAPAPVALSAVSSLWPARVLLVEDEPAVAAGISMLLEAEGFVVEMVDRGEAAVAAIERFAPNLVILDIGLPDIDGTEVYRRIDARWPDLPVLFSSGHAHAANLDRFIEKPHVGLLMKPYDFATLMEAISSLQSRRAATA